MQRRVVAEDMKPCCLHVALGSALAGLLSPALAAGSIDAPLAKVGQCSTAPDSPSFDAIDNWDRKLQRNSYNRSVFGLTSNLYIKDRCFVPRRVCKVHVTVSPTSSATLLLPREGPSNHALHTKQYDVVIGAAQVMGVVARTSFGSLLEQQGGLPVINLGKGAAGPHIYLDPINWPILAPLFVNARAIIICVMAGRSSPNSESGAFSGQSFGGEQLHSFDRVLDQWKQGGAAWRKADTLRRESLDSARRSYIELVRRVRAGAPAGQPPARILLTWFSPCPISGCSALWEYPQYYMKEPWRSAPSAPTNILASLGSELGAEIVDLSYGHLPPSPPIPVDQCNSCQPTGTAVCNSPTARQEALSVKRTCGSSCGLVRDPYYPDTNAHEYASKVLETALKAPPSPHIFSAPAEARLSLTPSRGEPLPRLSLEGKIFYSHIHKAAGTNLIAYVTGFESVTDCSTAAGGLVVKEDHTTPSSWETFERWWFDPQPSCNFATLEYPEIGDIYSKLKVAAEVRSRQTATASEAAGTGVRGKGRGRMLSNAQEGEGHQAASESAAERTAYGTQRSAHGAWAHGQQPTADGLLNMTGRVGASGRQLAASEPVEPQIITFLRHPVARCRSHWNYEQASAGFDWDPRPLPLTLDGGLRLPALATSPGYQPWLPALATSPTRPTCTAPPGPSLDLT